GRGGRGDLWFSRTSGGSRGDAAFSAAVAARNDQVSSISLYIREFVAAETLFYLIWKVVDVGQPEVSKGEIVGIGFVDHVSSCQRGLGLKRSAAGAALGAQKVHVFIKPSGNALDL